MSAIVKTKLKAAKEAVGKKDYEKARDAALAVLDYDSENYHAYVATNRIRRYCLTPNCSNVFLGISYLNLGELQLCEQVT